MTEEKIIVELEEEVVHQPESKSVTEEISVIGAELWNTLKGLMQESTVQRIVVKKGDGDILFEVPLIAGVVSLMLLGPWTALVMVGALAANFSIVVIREVPATDAPKATAADMPESAEPAEVKMPAQCQATTKSGNQCKRNATSGSSFCAQHASA